MKKGRTERRLFAEEQIKEAVGEMKREDMLPPDESDYKGECYMREIIARENYNDALQNLLNKLKIK